MQVNLYQNSQCSSPISIVVITHLIHATLHYLQHHCLLTVNIYLCSPEEMQQLNATFRGIELPTDILSFAPNNTLTLLDMYHLGDLVIAPSVLTAYSTAHQLSLEQHWYHLLIHGVLHLLGYDHVDEAEALVMENLEHILLQRFNLKVAPQDCWLDG